MLFLESEGIDAGYGKIIVVDYKNSFIQKLINFYGGDFKYYNT